MSRKDRITAALNILEPSHLNVTDFSEQHNVPKGEESHIQIVMVSENFLGKNRIQRHRMVYQVLAEEMKQGLHALQLQLFTEKELETANISPPPRCRSKQK